MDATVSRSARGPRGDPAAAITAGQTSQIFIVYHCTDCFWRPPDLKVGPTHYFWKPQEPETMATVTIAFRDAAGTAGTTSALLEIK